MKSKYPGNLLPTNLRFWNFLFLIKIKTAKHCVRNIILSPCRKKLLAFTFVQILLPCNTLKALVIANKNNNDVLSKLSKCKNNLSKHNNKLKNDLEHKLRFPNFYDLNSWSYKLCINFLHAWTLQHHLHKQKPEEPCNLL